MSLKKTKAYQIGLDQGKQDAFDFKGYQPEVKKDFKMLFKLLINADYAKQYKLGYSKGFSEIVEARKLQKQLKELEQKDTSSKKLSIEEKLKLLEQLHQKGKEMDKEKGMDR